MMKLEDKKKILEKAIKELRKKKGNENLNLEFGGYEKVEVIATPFPSLNALLNGGFPRGKFTTIAGPERTAKGTLITQVIGYQQQKDPDFCVLWSDAEHSKDLEWDKSLGVDPDRMIIQRYTEETPNMETMLDQGLALIKTGTIDMWVIDSIAALLPKAEDNKDIEENTMLDLQKKMGVFFRKSIKYIAPNGDCKGVAGILIGQVYNVLSTTNAGLTAVKGGNAVKHWAHIRIMTRRGNQDEAPGKATVITPDGNSVVIPTGWAQHLKLEKTRVNDKEGQSIILPFIYGRGLDSVTSSITSMLYHEVIERSGAWFSHSLFPNGKIQGKQAVVDFLQANPTAYNQLVIELDKFLLNNVVPIGEVLENDDSKNS